jgi:predicted RecA/RadA family phage recombinase
MELSIRNSSGDIQGANLVGEIFIEDGKIYKIVKNAEASTAITEGDVVVNDGTAGTDVKIGSSVLQVSIAGVAAETIAAGEYGRIIKYGVANCKVDGGTTDVAAGASLAMGGAAGYAYTSDDKAGTTFGHALAAVTTKTTAKVMVRTL